MEESLTATLDSNTKMKMNIELVTQMYTHACEECKAAQAAQRITEDVRIYYLVFFFIYYFIGATNHGTKIKTDH